MVGPGGTTVTIPTSSSSLVATASTDPGMIIVSEWVGGMEVVMYVETWALKRALVAVSTRVQRQKFNLVAINVGCALFRIETEVGVRL